MPTKKRDAITFRFDLDIRTALETIKERDGIPINEQIRRAVLLWIDNRNLLSEVTTRALAKMAQDDVRRMGRTMTRRRLQ